MKPGHILLFDRQVIGATTPGELFASLKLRQSAESQFIGIMEADDTITPIKWRFGSVDQQVLLSDVLKAAEMTE